MPDKNIDQPKKTHPPETPAAVPGVERKDPPMKAPGFQQGQPGSPSVGSSHAPTAQSVQAKPVAEPSGSPQNKSAAS